MKSPASTTEKHMPAPAHFYAVEGDLTAVVFENAVHKCAVYEVFAVEFHRLIDEGFAFYHFHQMPLTIGQASSRRAPLEPKAVTRHILTASNRT
jgi:hypothetical protein